MATFKIEVTEGKFDFTSFNDLIKITKPSAGMLYALAESATKRANDQLYRYKNPLLARGQDVENSIAILRNAVAYSSVARRTNPNTTLSVDELVQGGINLAHEKTMAKINKAQDEANRGRPEMTYPSHTNSGDAGKIA